MLTLMDHQHKAAIISKTRSRYGLWWKPGTGKTIASFAMIADAYASGFMGRVVVVAPKSILNSTWLDDSKNFPSLRTIVTWSDNPTERKRLIGGVWDVAITNKEQFKRHATDYIKAGVKWLIFDESSGLKNHDAQITKISQWFSAQMDRVTLLSGTPAPNSEIEYVPQLITIDPAIFGTTNFYRVANAYFSPVKRFINGKDRIFGWRLMGAKRADFYKILQENSWALSREECIDLPGEQDIIRRVVLSDHEADAYISMVEQLRVEIGNDIHRAKPTAKLMKLRQLTSGILYTDDEVKTLGTSKLDALGELLDELGNEQVVIWAEFTAEIDAIMNLLAARGASHEKIDGSVSLDNRTNSIERFQAPLNLKPYANTTFVGRESPVVAPKELNPLQYLVCQPMAAGHGVTLTAAANDIFFSLSYSYETHEQSRCRTYRKGQDHKVAHYYLIAQGTVDEVVLKSLRGKRDASEAVMEYLRHKKTEEVLV